MIGDQLATTELRIELLYMTYTDLNTTMTVHEVTVCL